MNIWFRVLKKINNYLEYSHKRITFALVIFTLIFITLLDLKIKLDISFSVFYSFPIVISSWFISKEIGFLMVILSACIELLVNSPRTSLGSLSLSVYWNFTVQIFWYLLISYLFYQLRSSLDREQELARIDDKTGVANKRLFLELSRLEVKKANRYRHPLTVVYMDIDDFEKINRELSYGIGDKILQVAAETMRANLRETDIIARIGGDEFIILLPGNGYESAQTVIYRVQKELLIIMQNNDWPVTFSIGAVTFINPPKSVEEMIQCADRLMYLVKNNGKNQLKHKASVGEVF
ncbi:MAG TPA: GGDEF domain-containing protein [Waterburya sp.]|jgi:diguanylate cyclase (GGDEF)-like protein